jgi:2-oxo-4-hydroxy-4-carboxy--5-ureidoimidazoline (OHCU) decarboxylase
MDLSAWLARFGAVFEHSPWVAETAWRERPYASADELHGAMMRAVENASRERKLALVRAHPELGFDRLSRQELDTMADLNRRYREKFGFPCIVALRLHANRQSVMREMERRLGNNADTELANALEQIAHITRGRLEKIFHG